MSKKIWPLVGATTLTLLLAACGGGNDTPAPTGGGGTTPAPAPAQPGASAVAAAGVDASQPAFLRLADTPHNLSWYINFSWFTNPTGTAVHQRIAEDTGITIDFVIPAGNAIEQLYTMIAANTLPDIMTLAWTEPIIAELIDAGMVYAINVLADRYDPYFWNVANPGRVDWYTSPNGNFYQIPNQSFSIQDTLDYDISSSLTFVVRYDMWNALGRPDMTTPDGFVQTLRDARDMFPTVDGLPLIPIGLDPFTSTGNNSLEDFLMSYLAPSA